LTITINLKVISTQHWDENYYFYSDFVETSTICGKNVIKLPG
jgi:hypothetical protein